ncbi:MAG: redoxin domain-containing protein [Planctomycetia bacterium]|nr:redoxin domain-containing protein [Planctomycetia bacterium]
MRWENILRHWIVGLLLLLLLLPTGCKRRRERLQQERQQSMTTDVSVPPQVVPHREPDPFSQGYTTVPVAPVLEGMVNAYKNAQTYRDNGELQVRWTRDGKQWERNIPYRTNLERPNRIQIQVGDTLIHSDGIDFRAYTPRMPGMMIHRKCGKEIRLLDLLCDREIYLNLIDVESNRFSFLPAPLVLLLADKPLDTFLYGIPQQNLSMLEEKTLENRPCYRISAKRGDEETLFWIDKENFLLRKVELPVQTAMKEKSSAGTPVDSMTITLDFHDAERNGPAGEVKTTLTLPSNVREVTNYMPPQLELLGKPAPDFTFVGLNGEKFTPASLKGKNVVLVFWTTYGEPSRLIFEQLEKVVKKFQNENIVFLAVNDDASNVTNASVATALVRFGSSFLPARDPEGATLRKFHSAGTFALFLIDTNGLIQSFDSEYSPSLGDTTLRRIGLLLEGKPVSSDVLRQLEKSQQDYIESITRWVENGIFLDQVEIMQVSIPEAKISPSSEPVAFQKTEIWKNTDLKAPGSILVLPGENGNSDTLFVLENGDVMTQISPHGKVLNRFPLPLENGSFEIAALTAVNPKDGKRYFVTYGKQVHVFDEQWKPVFHYPDKPLSELSDLVADVVVDDLDGDQELEFYVSFWSGEGVHRIGLDGKPVAHSAADDVVFQMAAMHHFPLDEKPKPGPALLCIDPSGIISVWDARLNLIGSVAVKDRTLGWIAASDLSQNGTENIVAVSIAVGAKYKAVGITPAGKELWSLNLPDGAYPRPIDKIFPVHLKNPVTTQGQWLLLGADSSLHLIDMDGILVDRFNFGKIINGIASATLNGKPVLLISTPDDLRAMEFVW